jgi:nicotinamide riboside kinase
MAVNRSSGVVLCITGPECTGKTTLAEALATALSAPLVPEVARNYLADRVSYTSADVLEIARAQLQAEQRALAQGAPVVVADTDLSVIQVWWEEKYGSLDPWILQALGGRSPRRYLLTQPDLPWEFDPLRESPHDRERLHLRYREILEGSGFPFCEVGGSGSRRLENALDQVRRWGYGGA